MRKWTVILQRGPLLPDLTWEHSDSDLAIIRAHALSSLHGNVKFRINLSKRTITVLARKWYNKCVGK